MLKNWRVLLAIAVMVCSFLAIATGLFEANKYRLEPVEPEESTWECSNSERKHIINGKTYTVKTEICK